MRPADRRERANEIAWEREVRRLMAQGRSRGMAEMLATARMQELRRENTRRIRYLDRELERRQVEWATRMQRMIGGFGNNVEAFLEVAEDTNPNRRLLSVRERALRVQRHADANYVDNVWDGRDEKKVAFFSSGGAQAYSTDEERLDILSSMRRGVADDERIGSELIITDVSINMEVALRASPDDHKETARVFLFIDHQNNEDAAGAVPSDFLQYQDATEDLYLALTDPQSMQRYTVLWDKRVTLAATAAWGKGGGAGWYDGVIGESSIVLNEQQYGPASKTISYHAEMELPIKYVHGIVSASPSTHMSNILILAMVRTNTEGTTNYPTFQWEARVRYYDGNHGATQRAAFIQAMIEEDEEEVGMFGGIVRQRLE